MMRDVSCTRVVYRCVRWGRTGWFTTIRIDFMTRISWSLVVGVLVSAAVGCGGGTGFEKPVPVTGKVVFQGKPVDGAMVTFLSKAEGAGRSASGQTAADGSFSLTTFKTGDGALPGDYLVTVSKVERGSDTEIDPSKGAVGADYGAQMMAAAKGGDALAKAQKATLPTKYASAAESDIVRTVAKTPPNVFEIELK